MSGDNDFAPVLNTVKELYYDKYPGLITPPYDHKFLKYGSSPFLVGKTK